MLGSHKVGTSWTGQEWMRGAERDEGREGCQGRRLYVRWLLGVAFDGGQYVTLATYVQAAIFPRLLQLHRPKIVPQATLASPDHGHQAKVGQLVVRVDRIVLALEHDRHVGLLDEHVDDLTGRGARADLEFEVHPCLQPRIVGGVYLRTDQPPMSTMLANPRGRNCLWTTRNSYLQRDQRRNQVKFPGSDLAPPTNWSSSFFVYQFSC